MAIGKLPTLEQLQQAMASPVVPYIAMDTTMQDAEVELSTDEMIKELFGWMKMQQAKEETPPVGTGPKPGVLLDTTYNSATTTYNGGPATVQYNGNGS